MEFAVYYYSPGVAVGEVVGEAVGLSVGEVVGEAVGLSVVLVATAPLPL